MVRFISEFKPIARKAHRCDASAWLSNVGYEGLTFSELRAVVKARANRWKIQKGETYIRQTLESDGDLYTFKAIPAIHEICIKYDYYRE